MLIDARKLIRTRINIFTHIRLKLKRIRPQSHRRNLQTQGKSIGCAVRFRLKRNDAKIKQNLFRFEAKKICFFACFASKRKAGNQKRNESEQSENIIGKRKGMQKMAKIKS
jgi:hypothetical protein